MCRATWCKCELSSRLWKWFVWCKTKTITFTRTQYNIIRYRCYILIWCTAHYISALIVIQFYRQSNHQMLLYLSAKEDSTIASLEGEVSMHWKLQMTTLASQSFREKCWEYWALNWSYQGELSCDQMTQDSLKCHSNNGWAATTLRSHHATQGAVSTPLSWEGLEISLLSDLAVPGKCQNIQTTQNCC
jgi:hypothetical protein